MSFPPLSGDFDDSGDRIPWAKYRANTSPSLSNGVWTQMPLDYVYGNFQFVKYAGDNTVAYVPKGMGGLWLLTTHGIVGGGGIDTNPKSMSIFTTRGDGYHWQVQGHSGNGVPLHTRFMGILKEGDYIIVAMWQNAGTLGSDFSGVCGLNACRLSKMPESIMYKTSISRTIT